jgi:flagellar protein FliO/FliZ
MDLITLNQIVTLALFMGALGALWWLVQRNKAGLSGRLAAQRRLRVVEATALGPRDRALILAVDGREFLVITARGTAPQLHPLQTPEGAA